MQRTPLLHARRAPVDALGEAVGQDDHDEQVDAHEAIDTRLARVSLPLSVAASSLDEEESAELDDDSLGVSLPQVESAFGDANLAADVEDVPWDALPWEDDITEESPPVDDGAPDTRAPGTVLRARTPPR